jgi:electron transport complex protein RnfG
MSKGNREIIKNLFVLTLITVIAGLGLALTFNLTKDQIAEAERQEVLKSIRYVMPKDDAGNPLFVNEPDTMSFTREITGIETGSKKEITFYPGIDKEGNVIGFAIKTFSTQGYAGDIGFMVGVDRDGTIIDSYILSILETPGLGTKINEEPFKGQFKGKSVEAGDAIILIKDDKQNGDLDSVTGATISSRAMTNVIREAAKYYFENKDDIIAEVKIAESPTADTEEETKGGVE